MLHFVFVLDSCAPKIENKQFCVIYSGFLHVFDRQKKNRGITAILYMDGTPDEDVIVFNDLDEQTSPS